ncbi:hypothetical protein ABDD95_05670 [Mucilaginibacter sp. PAMB04274]|uniref:hypothetical protein n=1 Tax=Mucilaginibacter sp. PAMB04274 TaxID=3138568 RepID=UPI0031F6A90E
MKWLSFLLILLFNLPASHAQETVKRTNKNLSFYTEKFEVLKSDKKIRHGLYKAVDSKDTLIAQGLYSRGKRIGHWVFYNYKGEPVQNYDYSNKKLYYYNPDDAKYLKYHFTDSVHQGDTVRYPVKIGGSYYGLNSFVNAQPDLVRTLTNDFPNTNQFPCDHIFTVSPEGKLIKHEALVTVNNTSKLYLLTDKEFDEDSKEFIPATVNHTTVECKVVMNVVVNVYSTLRR